MKINFKIINYYFFFDYFYAEFDRKINCSYILLSFMIYLYLHNAIFWHLKFAIDLKDASLACVV